MFSRRIGWKSLASTCRSLATMLHSGVAIKNAFKVVANKSGDPTCRHALKEVNDAIACGDDVSSAMRAQGEAFPELMIDMVGVAEQTGALPEILESLANHYENNLRLRRNFLSSIAFPVFQLVMAILVVAGMITILGWIASSRGGEAFDPLGFGLSGTQGAITWLVMTFGTIIGLLVGVQILYRSVAGRKTLDSFLMKIPVVGHCTQSFAIARFSWAFALTQQAGMDILKSLDSSFRATTNGAFIAAIPKVTGMVKAGEPLHDAMRETRLFPEEYMHMVEVSEQSGTVPEMLDRLGPQFEEQARRSLSALVSVFGWLIWLTIATFIVILIFRVFFTYIGMLNEFGKEAMGG